MRKYVNPGAKINLTTRARIWNNLNNGNANYTHWILWEADSTCPPGFLAQKVKRDIKYRYGRVIPSSGPGRLATWEWGIELQEAAEYWEIWEVVVKRITAKIGSVHIYPAASGVSGEYATSHGRMPRQQLKLDQNKRPPATPESYSYWAHDVFEERNPNSQRPVKGKFKIKGSVYFLPSGNRAADDWVDRYLRTAQRELKFGPNSNYTGGPLWQNAGDFAKPDSTFRNMTRFEAGEFYDVRREHLQVGGLTPTLSNPPDIKTEWKDRVYPLHRWQTYP